MRVGNGKTDALMKEPACLWHERLAEDHRRHCQGAHTRVSVIQRLCPPSDRTGKKALVIPGGLAIPFEPADEPRQCCEVRSFKTLKHVRVGLQRCPAG